MVDGIRQKRIGESIQHALGSMLLYHREQPIFSKITITAVKVSPDLSVAKVFFSVFDEEKVEDAKNALQEAAWVLRKGLAKDLNLRVTPRLTFVYDESIKRGQALSALIDESIRIDEARQEK